MPIDKSFEGFLTSVAKQPDICDRTPTENRIHMKEVFAKPQYNQALASIMTFDKNILLDTRELGIRIYHSKQKNSACLVWFHGGGFVFGSLDSSDYICRKIALETNLTIVSVDYRLAPENKFPCATDDAYFSTNWVIENAKYLEIDPGKILIGGSSAGATLAAVTCLKMRDNGLESSILHQFLMLPMTDNDFKSKSYQMYGENYFLTTKSIKYFLNHYVKTESDLLDPYCLPGKAQNLKNLPKAFVITAECDPLRDEGEHFAHRLKEAGNNVEYQCIAGIFHGFMSQAQSNPFAENSVNKMVASYAKNIEMII